MEQRRALGTRLVGAVTIAFVLLLVMTVVTPVNATITSVSPSSATVVAGNSTSFRVNLSGSDSCLGAISPTGMITLGVSPRCISGAGSWSATVSVSVAYDTPAGTYVIDLSETPQVAGGTSDFATFSLTVQAAPPTTTTTTVPEGTTTTTDPTAPPPPPPTTTTLPPTTTTAPPPPTTQPPVTTPPPVTTQPPPPPPPATQPVTSTTAAETPTTSVNSGPVPEVDITTTTVPLTATADEDLRETVLAAPPITPEDEPPAAPAQAAAAVTPEAAETPRPVVAALEPPRVLRSMSIDPVQAFSLRDLAEAIPRSLKDLVVSPFVIIGVIAGAIRDTGAATIWALVIVIPFIIDWRAVRKRFRAAVVMGRT